MWSSLEMYMNKYAHFGHVLHFSGLTYGRHRVQGVKIGGLQPELAFQQIVSQTLHFIEDFPLLFSGLKDKKIRPLDNILDARLHFLLGRVVRAGPLCLVFQIGDEIFRM